MNEDEIEIAAKKLFKGNSFIGRWKYKLRTFCTNLRYLWALRNIRHWDGDYIYESLKIKLEFSYENMVNESMHTTSERDAKNIKKVLILLDRMLDSEYYEHKIYELLDKLRESRTFEDLVNDTHEIDYETPEKQKLLSSIRKEHDKAHKKREKDKKELFKLLRDHVDEWWS